jgi:hypothetical protein
MTLLIKPHLRPLFSSVFLFINFTFGWDFHFHILQIPIIPVPFFPINFTLSISLITIRFLYVLFKFSLIVIVGGGI